jgi:hypothetical protein
MSQLESLKGRTIDLDHIQIFGCTIFVHAKKTNIFNKNSIKPFFFVIHPKKKV